jgi:hypothetical protein
MTQPHRQDGDGLRTREIIRAATYVECASSVDMMATSYRGMPCDKKISAALAKEADRLRVAVDIRSKVDATPAQSREAAEGAGESCRNQGCGETVGDTKDPRWDQGQCPTCDKWYWKAAPPKPAPPAQKIDFGEAGDFSRLRTAVPPKPAPDAMIAEIEGWKYETPKGRMELAWNAALDVRIRDLAVRRSPPSPDAPYVDPDFDKAGNRRYWERREKLDICPRCGSSAPHMHPAVQHEGEVELCTDKFHLRPTNQNTPEYIAAVEAKRAFAAPVPSPDEAGEREKFELQNLLNVIEAMRGGRTVLRVSGNRGDSADVGVIGINRFVEICNVVLRSPSSAVAAGPIGWLCRSQDNLEWQYSHGPKEPCWKIRQPVYARLPVRGEREAIARVAEQIVETCRECRLGKTQASLDYNFDNSRVQCIKFVTDAILNRVAEEIERLTKLLNGRDDFIVSKGLWSEFTDSLSRQPPHSSSEGGR